MLRGEFWTVSAQGYAGKPRPVLIVQADDLTAQHSCIVCPVTSDPTDALFRPPVHPSAANGLRTSSRTMVDKVSTVPASRFGNRIGVLEADLMAEVEGALLVVLGFR